MGSSAKVETQVAAAMDAWDGFSLLELDRWLVESPSSLPAEGAALSLALDVENSRHPTQTINATDSMQPEACQAPIEPQERQDGAVQVDAPPPKRLRRGKSSSQRQKEEMALLRQQAAELQAQAARLRGVNLTLSSGDGSSLEALDAADSCSVWLDVAKRQQSEEKRAKEANAKLRDALVAHTKFVQRLDRVLQKAAVPWLASTPSREDRAVFVCLARSVEEQVLPQLDDVFGRRWQVSHLDGVANDRHYPNALGDRVADAKDTTLFPFSHRMVDEVSWRSMRNGKLQFGLQADAAITPADDMLACQVSVRSAALRPRNSSEAEAQDLKTYVVVKRRQQADRVVHAWETLALLPVVDDPLAPPTQIIGRGWSETAPRRMRNGTEGCVTRSYTQWRVRGRGQERSDHVTAQIVKKLIKEHDHTRVKINQSLENLLLDEAVRIRKRRR